MTTAQPGATTAGTAPKLGVYWTIGDPNLPTTLSIARALVDGGVDLLELGLPFSDPLLDGPLIQQSHHRATASGVTFQQVCDALTTIVDYARPRGTQVSVMTASQLLYVPERRAALPPVDGLLITDISSSRTCPFELPSPRVYFVSQDVVLSSDFRGLPNEPISMIYLTRLQGLTGAGQQAGPATAEAVARLRGITELPIWLGFGISTPEDVAACRQLGAVGGIIGSAFVDAMQKQGTGHAAGRRPEPEVESEAISKAIADWLAPFRRAVGS